MSIEEQFVEEDLICLRIEFKATVSDVLRSGRLLNLILSMKHLVSLKLAKNRIIPSISTMLT